MRLLHWMRRKYNRVDISQNLFERLCALQKPNHYDHIKWPTLTQVYKDTYCSQCKHKHTRSDTAIIVLGWLLEQPTYGSKHGLAWCFCDVGCLINYVTRTEQILKAKAEKESRPQYKIRFCTVCGAELEVYDGRGIRRCNECNGSFRLRDPNHCFCWFCGATMKIPADVSLYVTRYRRRCDDCLNKNFDD